MDLHFRHTEESTEAFIWTNAGTSPTIKEMELKEREFNKYVAIVEEDLGILEPRAITSTFCPVSR